MDLIDFKKFDSAEVGYNEEAKYVSLKYLKESKSEDLRNFCEYALDLKIKYNSNKWFLDKRKENIYPSDLKWFLAVWFKKVTEISPLTKEKPRYIAMIMPINFYSEYTTEEFIAENNSKGIIFNIFENKEDAHKWLLEHN